MFKQDQDKNARGVAGRRGHFTLAAGLAVALAAITSGSGRDLTSLFGGGGTTYMPYGYSDSYYYYPDTWTTTDTWSTDTWEVDTWDYEEEWYYYDKPKIGTSASVPASVGAKSLRNAARSR